MNIPDMREDRILILLRGICEKWGGPDQCREVVEALKSVRNHQGYLKKVAATPAGAQNLVAAAILGLTIAGHLTELVERGTTEPPPGPTTAPSAN